MTKVREFMTGWEPGQMSAMLAWSERSKEDLCGAATGKRKPPKLRPFDLISEPHRPVFVFSNQDVRVAFESAAGVAPFFRRNIDFDEAIFQFAGKSTIESEMAINELLPGEMLVIPRGIARRSIGDADSLRMTVAMHAPVTSVMGEELCVGRTRFEVKRFGGPALKPLEGPIQGAALIEKMFVWDEDPADATEVRRRFEDVVNVSSTERDRKVSAVKKLRPFDLFTEVTGRRGPGPKFLATPTCMMEVYNTVGEQFAFHRALESEEFGLQFMGASENMSEFEASQSMTPGELFLIPLGIAHSVRNCKADFRRMVIYSRYPFKVHVDESMHKFNSRFEVSETIVEDAPWHSEARELAGASA
ncbi:MAG TPA: hypothetical protein VN905_05625 [Candidatus Binatia bacterium]|nr:hypothetical protein [Candidatus Binatia bacterium]